MSGVTIGFDLGTSGIKIFISGLEQQLHAPYHPAGLGESFAGAMAQVARVVPPERISAVGFSGQTGTFMLEENGVVTQSIAWHEPGREPFLERARSLFSREQFMEWTGMEHPAMASYPLPTILFFQSQGALRGRLAQPKDRLIELLSGTFVSDTGSWRGLVNPISEDFEPRLLQAVGIRREQLPRIERWTRVNRQGAKYGLREGTPIAVGYNDFYATLQGLSADAPGDCFDITGTSEHFGVVADAPEDHAAMIDSPYLGGLRARYGVTASSGVSLDWGMRLFGRAEDIVPGAPIFLPYLKGERQPVSDANARGMFVGLTPRTDNRALAYAVAEGVAFSVFSLYEALGCPPITRVLATGGATASALLNRLKASLLNAPYQARQPDCGSALGAVRAAGGTWHTAAQEYAPDEKVRSFLLPRYALYSRCYAAWRDIVSGSDPGRIFEAEKGEDHHG